MTDLNNIAEEIKLTAFSHGAGCGCKISPMVLDIILKNNEASTLFPGLIVGNSNRDDAAVLDIGNNQALISTTDFFMPVVDDPYDFGRIASANAISDVYAMGGKPVLAIAILGWPIDKISPEIASKVIAGSRAICEQAGIPLAGGHSIDSPEPIFGLAVNGIVNKSSIKKNSSAKEGDLLFLTKPIGIGILTTSSKRKILRTVDLENAVKVMTTLNNIGEQLGGCNFVNGLTDVTGFGLLGHLIEMTESSGLSAELAFKQVPLLEGIDYYLEQGAIPGGTQRNWQSYGHKVNQISERTRLILADPQTSGGLLISADPEFENEIVSILKENNIEFGKIGKMGVKKEKVVYVRE